MTIRNFLLSIVSLMLIFPAIAQETFKCTNGGATVIQDSPCPGAAKRSSDMPVKQVGSALTPAPSAAPAEVAKSSDLDRQKAFMAKGAKDRRISDLQFEISRTEASISQMQANMNAEIAALDRQKSSANNNLAGATYLNSLATEQQAISTRYSVEISTQRDRLKQLQDQLAAEQKKP